MFSLVVEIRSAQDLLCGPEHSNEDVVGRVTSSSLVAAFIRATHEFYKMVDDILVEKKQDERDHVAESNL
jgi:hypothetical protein